MSDTHVGSNPVVPIAIDSAAAKTEESRELFQARLSLFSGLVFLISGGFYAVYFFGTLRGGPLFDLSNVPVGNPNQYHLYATLVAGGLWVATRPQWQASFRLLGWLDVTSSFFMCTLFAVMALGIAEAHLLLEQDPVHGLFVGLLACSYVLLARAIAVPSTPRRTLAVSSLAMTPMAAAGVYLLPGTQVPGIDLSMAVLDILTWCVAAVAMTTVSSRVIFGLRAEIRKVRRLGQYTLEEKLGEGGMGIVYRASHAMLRRPTAIKMLSPEKTGEENIRRFEREVQLTASLSHPSTVVIFDYGRTPLGIFYYAMEYLDGLNLEQLVKHDGPQPPARVVHILHQVCGALAEAHGVGLIHRDVKPANIILSERGGMPDVAKVVDFGLVKPFETTSTSASLAVTSANVLIGTPLYMAPEAISGGFPVDGRSDLYALGAVGYSLLTGTPVFQAKNVVEVLAQHLQTAPEPPSARIDGIPPDLEQVVLRCLAKRPGDRYDDASSLQHALGRCAQHLPWATDLALQWWTEFKVARAQDLKAPIRSGTTHETITVDLSQRRALST